MRWCGVSSGIWAVALAVVVPAVALRADYIRLSVPMERSVVPTGDPAVQSPGTSSDANTTHLSVQSDGPNPPGDDQVRPTVPASKLKAEAPPANSGSTVEKPSNDPITTVRPLALQPVHIDSVPEPSSLGVLVVMGAAVLLRRRRLPLRAVPPNPQNQV